MNRSDYDYELNDAFDPYSDALSSGGGNEYGHAAHAGEGPAFEHPCLELKKMLSSGTFYYSVVRSSPPILQESIALDPKSGLYISFCRRLPLYRTVI